MKIKCPVQVGDRIAIVYGKTLCMSKRNKIRWTKISKVTYRGYGKFRLELNTPRNYSIYITYNKYVNQYIISWYDTPDKFPNMAEMCNASPHTIHCLAFDYETLVQTLLSFKIWFKPNVLKRFLNTAKQLKENNDKFFTNKCEFIFGSA